MTLLFQTTITTAIMIAATIYIIRLFKKRKNNLDFPNHLFVSSVVLLISAVFTIIQLYDLTMKWTGNAPMIRFTVIGLSAIFIQRLNINRMCPQFYVFVYTEYIIN